MPLARMNGKAERLEHLPDLGGIDLKPGKPRQCVEPKIDLAPRQLRLARHHHLGRLAPAQVEYHCGRKLESRQQESGIDAALEAVARVGVDAELAAGLGNVCRIPQSGFDQHIRCFERAPARFAAHDSGKRLNPILVGDDTDRRIEGVRFAIQGEQRFTRARTPDGQIALHLGGIEYVQRARAVIGDEVGDIDQRIDGAQPNAGEATPQPFR